MQKKTNFGSELQVSMCPRPDLSFCACKTAWLAPEILVCMGPSPHLWFLDAKKKEDRIISLHESQTWPVFFCKQNSMINTGITSLHGSHSSSLVFACKTATFGSELLVSMGPRTHLSFCECITAWFASQVLVSMCPSPHLCFLHVNRLLIHNYKSLCVPDLICRFVHEKQRD